MASRLNLGNAQKQRRDSAKPAGRPSAFVDTPVVYCGDNLEQRGKLPDACVDLIYIDPPFNSNRNYEVFWGETKEMRAFEDRHESTQAYIESSSSNEENLRGGLSRECRERRNNLFHA
jgi:DNA modification methylase